MEYLQQLKQQHPALAAKMQADEMAMQNEMNNLANNRTASTTYIIPVVVHVVWNTAAQNISIAQVLSQMDVLNEDFARMNADTVNTPVAFQSVAANPQIQFCLAQHDPSGNPTNGIEYTQTIVTSFAGIGDVASSSGGGADPWDMNHYFNIWVCNFGNGLLGVGIMPPGSGLSGAAIQFNAFGRTGTLLPPNHKGRVATHMIAHCFNLRHIWGDDNGVCTGDDLVADTPNQGDFTFGCPSFPATDTCSPVSPGIMFMNYMDYTDDSCMNMFTQGQALRMTAAINLYYSSLLTSTSCSPAALYSQTKGTVFYDANQNGLQDAGDIGIAFQKLLVMPDNDYYFSNYNGQYTLFLDTGTVHTVEFIPKPSWMLTSDSASFTFLADTGVFCCYDFGTSPSVLFDSLQISLTNAKLRCDSIVPFWINYTNSGTSLDSGVIQMTFDDSLSFVSSAPAPATILNDTIYWNYYNLQPGETRLIWIDMHTVPTDSILVCADAQINSAGGTATGTDGFCDEIKCSFDPNDKKVDPPGILSSHYTLKNIPLEYAVRFQNTGTDTAFTVIVRDTLNPLLNLNTFQILGYSHPVLTSINNQHIAEFRFDNILLPPAVINESKSHGFIKYKVYPLPGLPDGTVIDNSAHIYFDSNLPITTNNVFNTLVTVLPTAINSLPAPGPQFAIYPNPVFSTLTVLLNKVSGITISNVLGETVFKKKFFSDETGKIDLDVSALSSGIYFIKANSEVRKFVKE